MKEKKQTTKKKVGRGFVIRACNNVGLKTATAYYKALHNMKNNLPLSVDQKAVIKEYNKLIKD